MSITDFYFVYLIVFLELVSLDTGIVGQNLDSETFNNHDNDTSYFCPDDLNFGECPCVIRNENAFCCNIGENLNISKTCQKNKICTVTSVQIFSSFLNHESLDADFFLRNGVCPENIRKIIIRDSDLLNVTVGQNIRKLKTLDIRQNHVDFFNQPQSSSIDTIFLSENFWPCVDYTRFRDSSLELGVKMSWLLDPKWTSAWKDINDTFCYSFYKESQTLENFISFTKKTLAGCPKSCTCGVADEQRKVSINDIIPTVSTRRTKQEFKVNVFCTDLALTKMPLKLPPNTVFLNLENNQIRSLDAMSMLNPDYKHIQKLVLNNNSLTSLRGIETSWLHKNGPSLLDLRNNFITELDTITLEPMLYKTSSKHSLMWGEENIYYFADNPWSCNCHNIKTIQEFLNKYSNLIEDIEYMKCTECDCALLYLDYKEMCATRDSNMLWLVILEVCLLLAVLVKLSWDCVRYRRTGHLPWIARHMCWSVPGISRSRWSPRLPNIFSRNDSSTEENARRIVSKGSSGYITCSATSSNSGAGKSNIGEKYKAQGVKESSVVRFI